MVIYSDIDIGFVEHPVKNELLVKTDADAIKSAVRNLLLTNFYERPFRPDIGCGIRGLLFEPVDDITASALRDAIRVTITNSEPRVNLIRVDVVPSPDKYFYEVTVLFSLLNSSNAISLPLVLRRIR